MKRDVRNIKLIAAIYLKNVGEQVKFRGNDLKRSRGLEHELP